MKNILSICFLFFILFSFGKKSIAQDCTYPYVIKKLQGNNISADILIDGNLFWDRSNAGFSLNTNQYPFPSTIFASGLWLGAFDADENLRVSAATYNTGTYYDYLAGPINNDNGQISFDCDNFNQLWEVFGYEVEQHIADFEDNGTINNPIQNIYSYPAHQNPFFESIHGFSLPNTIHGLAPFFDNNNDGIYNPDDGDFPSPESVNNNTIPAHLIWGIFNDGNTSFASGGVPLNVEIHQTAWSFNCTDNEILNHSIFISQKLINKDSSPLDSMFVGFWNDFNLGCLSDDYVGCIPDLNTIYSYNKDSIDGFYGDICFYDTDLPSFGDNPPVQATTILNQELDNFIYNASIPFGTGPVYEPQIPSEFYTTLNGWFLTQNGEVPITYGSNGFSGTQLTSFVFPDHPSDSSGWSMAQVNLQYVNQRSTASIYFNSLQPNESKTIDRVFTLYQDENLNNFETVDLVYDNTPLLQQMYDNQFQNVCNIAPTCSNDCVWTGDANQDSIVNICDILQIGLGFNEQGEERNKPLTWYPYEGLDWNNSILGIDLKHTDCNGNAIIDSTDFELVDVYFDNSYKIDSPIDSYYYGPEISIIPSVNFDSISPGNVGIAKIRLNQEEDIYGISFTVDYNSELLSIENNIPIIPWSNTDSEQTYLYQKTQPEKGEHHFVHVKIDGQNSTTNDGDILRIWFEVNDSDYELIQTVIRLKNIKVILNDGSFLDYGSNEFLVNIINPDGEGIVLENKNLKANSIQIFPNPTTDILNIKIENPHPAKFTIFDIYGKKVFEKTEIARSKIQLPTSILSQGVYFLKIEMNGKETVEKFLKM